MNRELPDVQAGFRKGRGSRDQIANIRRIIEKAREFQKNIYFCFIDYAKAFDCVDHNKLWKILKEMGMPDLLICLLRNLYAGQEATFRTGHGTIDWFQMGKKYVKAVYCHPVYLTYTQSTLCEMPCWVKHKLESRLPGEISITTNMQRRRQLQLTQCSCLENPMDGGAWRVSVYGVAQSWTRLKQLSSSSSSSSNVPVY